MDEKISMENLKIYEEKKRHLEKTLISSLKFEWIIYCWKSIFSQLFENFRNENFYEIVENLFKFSNGFFIFTIWEKYFEREILRKLISNFFQKYLISKRSNSIITEQKKSINEYYLGRRNTLPWICFHHVVYVYFFVSIPFFSLAKLLYLCRFKFISAILLWHNHIKHKTSFLLFYLLGKLNTSF